MEKKQSELHRAQSEKNSGEKVLRNREQMTDALTK